VSVVAAVSVWSPKVIALLLLLFGFSLILLLLPAFGVIGSYWSLFELMSNRDLSRRIRVLTLAIVIALNGVWLIAGLPLVKRASSSFEDASIAEQVAATRQSATYLVIAAVFFIFPAISHGALWLIRGTVTFAIYTASAIRWVFRLHGLESAEALLEFLSTPLPLTEDSEQKNLLELERADIEALRDWALSRREVVQNRLVPITLLLAVLGLVANTSYGESAVRTAVNILQNYIQAPTQTTFIRFGLLAIIIMPPIVFLVELLNEAFVMDYIAQACVLAHHAKLSVQESFCQQVTSDERQIKKSFGWLDWLRRLMG
jgi:hypothetical protein